MHDESNHMMDWFYNTWGPFGWLFMILGWGIYFGVAIVIAYHVHKDAINRRIPNAEIWALIILIFNVLGLLVYLLLRGNYPKPDVSSKNQ